MAARLVGDLVDGEHAEERPLLVDDLRVGAQLDPGTQAGGDEQKRADEAPTPVQAIPAKPAASVTGAHDDDHALASASPTWSS